MAEAVGFEPTEHFYSSVFKTGAINRTLPHFHEKLGTLARTRTEKNNTPFERAAFTNLATRALDVRVRFELTVLQFCRLLHWASLPPHDNMVLRMGIEPIFTT